MPPAMPPTAAGLIPDGFVIMAVTGGSVTVAKLVVVVVAFGNTSETAIEWGSYGCLRVYLKRNNDAGN